jgi:hypothetical protein
MISSESYMRDINKHKQAKHEWYLNNKSLTQERLQSRREERRQWVNEMKRNLKCEHCGISGEINPGLLCFHHIDPFNKIDNVSIMCNNAVSHEKIELEISKCIVLCINCHRIVHGDNYNPDKHTSHQNLIKSWYADIKSKFKCECCGITDIRCLDFHHLSDKEYTLARLVCRGSSVKKILNEMSKCVCLCANCHYLAHDEK